MCQVKFKNIILLLIFTLFSSIAAAETYQVQIGDLIKISLPGEPTLNNPFSVNRQGRIVIPEVGMVSVVSLTEAEMKERVAARLSNIYHDLSKLQVYVEKKQILINVQGYVKNPGEFTLLANSSIQMALHSAGGLRSGAQLDRIQLVRKNNKQLFNYK